MMPCRQEMNSNDELIIANKKIALHFIEKAKLVAEIEAATFKLAFQNREKEERAAELTIANIELAFQNGEKERRAAELIVANQELTFQNREKEERAAELLVANIELAFQNKEKAKKAGELIIANKELAFQNQEKEERAAELLVANIELSFQNKEKEKRAGELLIANKELAFQNQEKEERAAELVIANNELLIQNVEKESRAAELIIVNKELEYLNKELEAFSYSVSHDLRSPIRAISGFTKILEEDYADKFDLEGVKTLQSIIHNSNRMGVLIDDLLSFSKLGRKEMIVSKIDMTALVKSIREELFQHPENRIEFNVKVLPLSKGDESLIRQVWVNLISNAVKFSRNRPKTIIDIGAYEENKFVVYFVKDNGAGFEMTYYDKLFGVFQRLHSQREFEGTGIGLAIVQKIIQRHNGVVWAESKLNDGASFYFSLPIITD
jgi:signal transduction histidine kinase